LFVRYLVPDLAHLPQRTRNVIVKPSIAVEYVNDAAKAQVGPLLRVKLMEPLPHRSFHV